MKTLLTLSLATILAVSCACGNEDAVESTPDTGSSDAGEDTQNSDTGVDAPADSRLCDSQNRLALLDEILRDLLADADWTFHHSSALDRAYALGLPATDGAAIGEASAFMPCTEAVDFDPYCVPDETTALSSCLRIGCESATVAYAEAYFTDGTTDSPDDVMAVSYTGTAGPVEFAVRPHRRWTNDLAAADKAVAADVSADFTVQVEGADQRFQYSGRVSTTDETSPTTTITLSFEELGGIGPAELAITHSQTAFEGTLTAGTSTVAIVETGVDWASCSE